MNNTAVFTTVTLIALGLVPAGINAQPMGDTVTTHDQARIAALLDRYETALNASDVDAVVEIEVHGDLAFARTGSKGTVRILADGTSAPEENRELFVFEKHRGEWKIARYMFNKTS